MIKHGKVAVIVPVFNSERYIYKCLDSILCQAYANLVVVVVNDGSTDGTNEILNAYKRRDSRIIVIDQDNKGQAAARNAGLEFAEKDKEVSYISFVDSDDCIDSNFLITHISNLVENQADVSVCGYASTSESDKRKVFFPERKISQRDFVRMIFSYGEWGLIHGCGGMVWKQLYRAEAIRGIRFIEDKNLVEDEIFCLNVAKSAEGFAYIPENLYHYTCVLDSLSHKSNFLKRLAKGRKICFEISRSLTNDLSLMVLSKFMDVILNLTKNGEMTCNLYPYRKEMIEAYKEGYVNGKMLKRYFLLCCAPNWTRGMYSLGKRIRALKKGIFFMAKSTFKNFL